MAVGNSTSVAAVVITRGDDRTLRTSRGGWVQPVTAAG